MSLPRSLHLASTNSGYRLIQTPVAELAAYRRESFRATADEINQLRGKTLPISGCALDISVEVNPGSSAGLVLDRDDQTLSALIELKADEVVLTIAVTGANESRYCAERIPAGPAEELRVIVDTASIEVFAGPSAISVRVPATEAKCSVGLADNQSPDLSVEIEAHSLGG